MVFGFAFFLSVCHPRYKGKISTGKIYDTESHFVVFFSIVHMHILPSTLSGI